MLLNFNILNSQNFSRDVVGLFFKGESLIGLGLYLLDLEKHNFKQCMVLKIRKINQKRPNHNFLLRVLTAEIPVFNLSLCFFKVA